MEPGVRIVSAKAAKSATCSRRERKLCLWVSNVHDDKRVKWAAECGGPTIEGKLNNGESSGSGG